MSGKKQYMAAMENGYEELEHQQEMKKMASEPNFRKSDNTAESLPMDALVVGDVQLKKQSGSEVTLPCAY